LRDIFKYVTNNPENLEDEYKNLCYSALGYNWEYKKSLNAVDIEFDPRGEYWLKVKGLYVEKWPEIKVVIAYFDALGAELSYKYFRRTYKRPYEDEMSKEKLFLTEFLDGIGPALFLGLARVQTTKRELQEIGEKLENVYHQRWAELFRELSSEYDLTYVGSNLSGAYGWL